MNKIIKNPAIGHSITFLQTAEQTNGRLLRIEYGVAQPENAPAIPLHTHLNCEERFEVVSGQMGVYLDGARWVLGAGEKMLIQPGTAHTFWNAGDVELRFITEIQPPGELQTYWETVFGLAQDGKVNSSGLPNLLQWAVVAPLADSYDPRVPLPIMKGVIFLLGLLGCLAGYKAQYPQYSSELQASP